jgi:hypothetical protein
VSHHRHEDRDHFIEDLEARQRNIVFPDTVRNGRSVDAFLWRGSPNPTMVQRIGAWILGLTIVVMGIVFLDTTRGDGFFSRMFSVAFILLGARIFRNGFPRREK